MVFSEHKYGLIDLKSTEDNKLKQIVQRNYSEISSEDYRFDRLELEIRYLKEMKKNEIVRTFEKFIEKNPTLLVIAVEGNFADHLMALFHEIFRIWSEIK